MRWRQMNMIVKVVVHYYIEFQHSDFLVKSNWTVVCEEVVRFNPFISISIKTWIFPWNGENTDSDQFQEVIRRKSNNYLFNGD